MWYNRYMGYETVVGIDLSYTSTGLVLLNQVGELYSTEAIKTTPDHFPVHEDRIRHIVGYVLRKMQPISKYIKLVCVEGYAYSAKYNRETSGELGGMMKCALREAQINYLVIPPTVLKKYATGKGNCDKDEVRLGVYKQWGHEAKTDDEIDAYVLAKIGYAVLQRDTKNQYQKSIIEELERKIIICRNQMQ